MCLGTDSSYPQGSNGPEMIGVTGFFNVLTVTTYQSSVRKTAGVHGGVLRNHSMTPSSFLAAFRGAMVAFSR